MRSFSWLLKLSTLSLLIVVVGCVETDGPPRALGQGQGVDGGQNKCGAAGNRKNVTQKFWRLLSLVVMGVRIGFQVF